MGAHHSGRCSQLDEKAADQPMGALISGEERFPETLSALEIEHFSRSRRTSLSRSGSAAGL
jgi:hypothetical protein